MRFYVHQESAIYEIPSDCRELYIECFIDFKKVKINLPENLSILSLQHEMITDLPTLPESLNELYCSGNYITELPELPEHLVILNCQYNQLKSLPKLPTQLVSLRCSSNQLTKIPPLPQILLELECAYNQLTNLPQLPELCYLNFGYNPIKELPMINQNIFLVGRDDNLIYQTLDPIQIIKEQRLLHSWRMFRIYLLFRKYFLRRIYRRRLILLSPLWLSLNTNPIAYNDILIKYF